MSYQVIVKPSNHTFTIETGESILQAALRQGISLPYGCRNGSCGACKGKILQGHVDYGRYDETTLTEQDKQNGLALFCCASALSDNLVIECHEVDTLKDIRIRTMPCRVHKLDRVAPDVMVIYLKLPTNERLQFLPGQYIDILLKDGKRRSFSLANAPHDDEFLQLHARNYPGGVFSEHVFTRMKEKDILRIEGPLGSFYLRETPSDKTPLIFLASGTGFAPIKSILEHILSTLPFQESHRKLLLYWGVRVKADLYLNDLVEQWANTYKNFSYIPVLSDALPTDQWKGRTGLVHQAVLEDIPNLASYQVYACGSPLMVKAAYQDFTQLRNLPAAQFFSDAFIPSDNQTP